MVADAALQGHFAGGRCRRVVDHNVVGMPQTISLLTEHFSHTPFDAVTLHGMARVAFGNCQPQTRLRWLCVIGAYREQGVAGALTACEHTLEGRVIQQTTLFTEALIAGHEI